MPSTEFVPELGGDIGAALFRATGNRSVLRTTMSLVHLRAGQICVHNTYLTILNTGFLRKAGESGTASPRLLLAGRPALHRRRARRARPGERRPSSPPRRPARSASPT
ncbi:hypothetical protein [Streptomyces sp. KL116D]|uniref:hypothetical protein n=1 Tax=Streptomyces sp. KL116D TaxID=3045152 RepID=UPI003558628D